MPQRTQVRLFGLLFVNFLLYGGVTTLIGATLPMAIRDFRWDYLEAGVVFASGAVGYFTTTFLAGLRVAILGPRRVMLAGLGLQALGVAMFGLFPQVTWNCCALALLGVGQGTTEVATNFSVVRLESGGASRLMNLIHSAFTIGAVSSPVLAASCIGLAGSWRFIYWIMAILTLVMWVFARIPSLPFPTPEPAGARGRASSGPLARQPVLWLLTLMLLLYVGAEMGISAWISEYTVKTYKVPPAAGALAVSLYWLGILVGRLLTSWLYRGTRVERALLGFGAVSAFCLCAALLAGNRWVAAAMFLGTGLGYSAIYPLAMTLAGRIFHAHQGMAIGVASTGGGVGACFFPFIMSAIANSFGILAGFWFYAGLTVAMTLTMLAIGILVASREAEGKPAT